MAAAGDGFAEDVEAAFAKQPGLKERLDESALKALQQTTPSQAVQVVEELAAKTDVSDPSAFVASALEKASAPETSALETSAPETSAPGPATSVKELLSAHPDLQKGLDEGAMRRLTEVDLSKATEVIEELVKRPGVRNPSAFVVHALSRSAQGAAASSQEDLLEAFPTVAARLDDRAKIRVRDSDQVRAREIMNEILNREDLQNPSAFVMKSLGHVQHRQDGPTGPSMQVRDYLASTQVETLLSGYPTLRSQLNSEAVRGLRETVAAKESDLTRVQEILQEIDSRGDVRNPSAFVLKALADPTALQRPETSFVGAEAMVSPQALLAAQYMLAAQAAQARLMGIPGHPGLTGLAGLGGLTSQYSQLTGLPASQLAAAQLSASQQTAPGFFRPPADPLQQMLRGRPDLRPAATFPGDPAAQAQDRSRSPRGWQAGMW